MACLRGLGLVRLREPVAGGRQIVVERLGGQAQRAAGDDGFGAEFGGAFPHRAAFSVAAEVEEHMAKKQSCPPIARFLFDNSRVFGACLALTLMLLIWITMALVARREWDAKGRFLRNPLSWLLLGLSIVVSLPGALLIYLMARPVTGKELTSNPATSALLLIYPAVVAMFVVGALL